MDCLCFSIVGVNSSDFTNLPGPPPGGGPRTPPGGGTYKSLTNFPGGVADTPKLAPRYQWGKTMVARPPGGVRGGSKYPPRGGSGGGPPPGGSGGKNTPFLR